MAELVLKVGPGAGYEDGDIIAAFNRRRIRCVHAQMITDVRKFGTTAEGLRPNSLAKTFGENCCQYRFERISETEVRRVEIASGQSEILGPTPNDRGEYIDVSEFVRRRLRQPGHAIFGTWGSEVWYGGRSDFSDTALDKVWTAIEAETSLREADHTLWPLGQQEMKSHFAITVTEFDDARADQLVRPVVEKQDVTTESLIKKRPAPGLPRALIKKRNQMVPWRTALSLPQALRNRIEDHSKSVDERARGPFVEQQIVQEKR